MIMIEAMACGTPVVALKRGSVPEIVLDGVTGFVRTELDELPAAIEAVGELDPVVSRAHVARNFDAAGMAERYERIYYRVAAHPPKEKAAGGSLIRPPADARPALRRLTSPT